MATATSRRAAPKPAVLAQRRKIAQELLDLNRKLAPQFGEMARLEADLKNAATEAGESFKEDFGAKGYVSASGAVAAEFKGNVPVIQTEIYLALPALERKRMEKSGAIKIMEQWGKASNGRVTVKVL